jgi:hypothetical protein
MDKPKALLIEGSDLTPILNSEMGRTKGTAETHPGFGNGGSGAVWGNAP